MISIKCQRNGWIMFAWALENGIQLRVLLKLCALEYFIWLVKMKLLKILWWICAIFEVKMYKSHNANFDVQMSIFWLPNSNKCVIEAQHINHNIASCACFAFSFYDFHYANFTFLIKWERMTFADDAKRKLPFLMREREKKKQRIEWIPTPSNSIQHRVI